MGHNSSSLRYNPGQLLISKGYKIPKIHAHELSMLTLYERVRDVDTWNMCVDSRQS